MKSPGITSSVRRDRDRGLGYLRRVIYEVFKVPPQGAASDDLGEFLDDFFQKGSVDEVIPSLTG